MNINKFVPVIGLGVYGWSLYVFYWARPVLVTNKIRELENEYHVNCSNGVKKELQEWKHWSRLSPIEQIIHGPPKRRID